MKLDGCADGEDYGRLQPIAVGGDPPFLFRQAQRHPKHIGIGLRSVLDCGRQMGAPVTTPALSAPGGGADRRGGANKVRAADQRGWAQIKSFF